MTVVDDAVERLIVAVNDDGPAGFRQGQIAIQWPSLAGALAELMDAYGRKPPGSWRVARREMQHHG
jgi:hypothetical protein